MRFLTIVSSKERLGTMSIDRKMIDGRYKYRYRCYYKDVNGRQKQRGSKWYDTKKEAVKAEIEFKTISKQTSLNPTFKEVADSWLTFKERTLKPSTIDTKIVYLNMLKSFNNRKMESITAEDINIFFDTGKVSKYKYSTKKTLMTNLKSIFKFAHVHFGVANDPFIKAAPIKKPNVTQSKKVETIPIITFKEFFDCMYTIKDGEWQDTASMYWTLYFTGLRISECASLTFNDVDDKYIYVSKQYIRGVWQTPKTKNSIRKVAIDRKTRQLINDQYNKYKTYPGFDKTWFVFSGYRFMNPEVFRNRKNIVCKKIGIPEFKIHALRHSHASNLIEAGVNMYKISKRLGHASIRTTMDIYGHLLDTEEKEILSVLEKEI